MGTIIEDIEEKEEESVINEKHDDLCKDYQPTTSVVLAAERVEKKKKDVKGHGKTKVELDL